MLDLLASARAVQDFGPSFSVILSGDAVSVDEVVRDLNIESSDAGSPSREIDAVDQFEDWMFFGEGDPTPFPVTEPENAPPAMRVINEVTLASTVLRDSELVRDLQLKQELLESVLCGWAVLVGLLEQDEEFMAVMQRIGDTFVSMLDIAESRRTRMSEEFLRDVSLMISFGGISMALASRKLLRALENCMSDPTFFAVPAKALMANLLATAVRQQGWASGLARFEEMHGRVGAAQGALRQLLLAVYYRDELTAEDEKDVRNFLAAQLTKDLALNDAGQRRQARARISQELTRNRMLARRRPRPELPSAADPLAQ
jgi:hypothetical protein